MEAVILGGATLHYVSVAIVIDDLEDASELVEHGLAQDDV
jgi:hypothetical protein